MRVLLVLLSFFSSNVWKKEKWVSYRRCARLPYNHRHQSGLLTRQYPKFTAQCLLSSVWVRCTSFTPFLFWWFKIWIRLFFFYLQQAQLEVSGWALCSMMGCGCEDCHKTPAKIIKQQKPHDNRLRGEIKNKKIIINLKVSLALFDRRKLEYHKNLKFHLTTGKLLLL